jgi:anion-transporting  ArsA/GET3 family ATPase
VFLIQDVITKRNKPVLQNIIKKQEQAEDLLTKSVFKLPDGSFKVAGVEARSIVSDLGKTYKETVDVAGKKLDSVIGLKSIGTSEISNAISKLSAKERANLLKTAQTEGLFKPETFKRIANPNNAISLASARETMQGLSKLIREKELGSVTGETIDVGRLLFLKKAFNEQIRKDAGTEYLDELQNFNSLVQKTNNF